MTDNPNNMPRCHVCGERIVMKNGRYYHAFWNGALKEDDE